MSDERWQMVLWPYMMAIPLLGVVSYFLVIWNVAPAAGVLHGLTTVLIAGCGYRVGQVWGLPAPADDTSRQTGPTP